MSRLVWDKMEFCIQFKLAAFILKALPGMVLAQ